MLPTFDFHVTNNVFKNREGYAILKAILRRTADFYTNLAVKMYREKFCNKVFIDLGTMFRRVRQ